jgi:hypothetical protein
MQAHARRPGDASPNGGAGGGRAPKAAEAERKTAQPLRDAARAAQIAAWIGAVGVGGADI